MGDHPRTLA